MFSNCLRRRNGVKRIFLYSLLLLLPTLVRSACEPTTKDSWTKLEQDCERLASLAKDQKRDLARAAAEPCDALSAAELRSVPAIRIDVFEDDKKEDMAIKIEVFEDDRKEDMDKKDTHTSHGTEVMLGDETRILCTVTRVIGSGGAAVVFEAYVDGHRRALKIIPGTPETVDNVTKNYDRLAPEVEALSDPICPKLYHAGLWEDSDKETFFSEHPAGKIFGEIYAAHCKTTKRRPHELGYARRQRSVCYLLLDYIDGFNIKQIHEHEEFLPESNDESMALFWELLERIVCKTQEMHKCGFAHCDLNHTNVMIEGTRDQYRVRIIDLEGVPNKEDVDKMYGSLDGAISEDMDGLVEVLQTLSKHVLKDITYEGYKEDVDKMYHDILPLLRDHDIVSEGKLSEVLRLIRSAPSYKAQPGRYKLTLHRNSDKF